MKKQNTPAQNRSVRIFCLILLALLTALCLCGCYDIGGSEDVLPKSQLASNVDKKSVGSYDYVAEYLDKWDFPQFNSKKLKEAENIFYDNCYATLPARAQHARSTAKFFLNNYYDKINLRSPEEMTEALIRSFVSTSGDKYARFRNKDELDEYIADLSGEFVGIGISVSYNSESGLVIQSVIEGSAAQKAGLLKGDVIYSVDSVVITESNYSTVIDSISGEAGTAVNIVVDRSGTKHTYSITRELIEQPSVKYYVLEDNIAHIVISAFNSNTDEQFSSAVDRAVSEGAEGIIFDLRYNPGGYLNSVIETIERLVPLNTRIVSYYTKNNPSGVITYSNNTNSIPSETPIVVLCNEHTASAGELFVAAMRDYREMGLFKFVSIVGQKTYGKGVMQDTYLLNKGHDGAITLTMAAYSPPGNKNYDGIGITPEITVPEGDGDTDAQLIEAVNEIDYLIARHLGTVPKEVILNRLEYVTPISSSYISDHLENWGFPVFNNKKLNEMQDVYNKETALLTNSDIARLAELTAKNFLENYYDSTDRKNQDKLTGNIIKAFFGVLNDEWAVYRTQSEFEDYEATLSGAGSAKIGFTFNQKTGIIESVTMGSGAYAAGIKAGDILWSVEGICYKPGDDDSDKNLSDILSLLKGGFGDTINVCILRGGQKIDTPITIQNIKSAIGVQITSDNVGEYASDITISSGTKIGYIKVTHFMQTTHGEFEAELDRLVASGVSGFIFDMRNNTGGLLDAVVNTIDSVVGKGVPVINIDYYNPALADKTITTTREHKINVPCVVLCNDRTASAAELFVSALKDYNTMELMDVRIVGIRTYGKGVMQKTQQLSDGSSITCTVASYSPPLGNNYNGKGITPDIIEENEEEQMRIGISELLILISQMASMPNAA